MRVLITTICLLLFGIVSNGQDETGRKFKPFKVDFSEGFAFPQGSGGFKDVGFLIAMEPKYALSDKFTLGIRWEAAIMARTFDSGTEDEDMKGQGNFSFTLTSDYYFNTNKLRPFIGGGPGYNCKALPIGGDIPIFDNFEFNFSYMLRTGFEIGHFRLGVEYNRIGSSIIYPNNSYLGYKISVFFGGGRIK